MYHVSYQDSSMCEVNEEFKNSLESLKNIYLGHTTHLIEAGSMFLSKSNFIYAARMLHSQVQEVVLQTKPMKTSYRRPIADRQAHLRATRSGMMANTPSIM